MLRLVVVTLLLSVSIDARSQCAEGTCPEGKFCCTVAGQTSCCDDNPDEQIPMRAVAAILRPTTDVLLQNATTSCSFYSCPVGQTCCNRGGGYPWCCPVQMATCCTGQTCCPFGNTCCSSGRCCPIMSRCCSAWGSPTWCCRSGYKCGTSYMKCRSGAPPLSPLACASAVVAALLLWLKVKMASM